MASKIPGKSCNSSTGWEMILYVPPPVFDQQISNDHQKTVFCPSEDMKSVVQMPGLDEKDVLMPDPLSIKLPQNVQERPEPPVVEEQKTKKTRGLSSAKMIAVSTIFFEFIRLRDYPDTYVLVMCDVGSSPEVEEIPGMKDESLLPLPDLLKGWTRETRERPSGARDKFYSHSTCKRLFRSLVEVVNYIKRNNNLQDATLENKLEYELQDSYGFRFLRPSSSSNGKKRKNNFLQGKSKSKKTKEQIELEEFYANAHNNLMNLSPPSPEAKEEGESNTTTIKAHFAVAHQNLVRGLQNEKGIIGSHTIVDHIGHYQNGSSQDMEDWINELLNK